MVVIVIVIVTVILALGSFVFHKGIVLVEGNAFGGGQICRSDRAGGAVTECLYKHKGAIGNLAAVVLRGRENGSLINTLVVIMLKKGIKLCQVIGLGGTVKLCGVRTRCVREGGVKDSIAILILGFGVGAVINDLNLAAQRFRRIRDADGGKLFCGIRDIVGYGHLKGAVAIGDERVALVVL